MGVFSEYSKSAIKHWKGLAMSLTTAAFIVVGWTDLQKLLELPWWAWAVIVLFSVNVTQFLVWKELRGSYLELLLQFKRAQDKYVAESIEEIRGRLQKHEQEITKLK